MLLDATRFSKWIKLVRCTAWVLRFVHNVARGKLEKRHGELDVEEIQEAEYYWIRHVQRNGFESELRAVKSGQQIPRQSPIKNLNPVPDDNGILRMKGRLQWAEQLPYETRNPIILPRRAYITKLIVGKYHEMVNHENGVNYVLADIRTRFWIVHGREAIKSYESEYNTCKKNRAKAATQIMAPLPKSRIGLPMRAFARCGVDYAGPFLTKQGREKSRTKRYLCLFTCCATRAVHLEMAWSLDANSFLSAFSRMISCRGLPLEVISDNSTNFVAAERELRELFKAMDKNEIKKSMTNQRIKWRFNPPGASHFGGFFEALIKSAKRAMKAVIGNAEITDEELLTTIVGVEGLMNSRPLTCQSAAPKDDPVQTPNHFLYGQLGGQIAPEVDELDIHPRRRWLRIQQIIKGFWRRWLREFLPAVNSRKKWTEEKKDIEVGNIVICIDPNLPRGTWPLGRVEVFIGPDKHVRTARIKIGQKQYV
jgi:hypothetical protein